MTDTYGKTVTVPLRDLTAVQIRQITGSPVTLMVYESADATEPAAELTGTLAAYGKDEDATSILFEHGIRAHDVPVKYPATLTFEDYFYGIDGE